MTLSLRAVRSAAGSPLSVRLRGPRGKRLPPLPRPLWFIVAGWWLVLIHLGVAFLLGITIVGIPLAVAVLKMSKLALAPYGKDVVELRHARDDAVVVQAPARR